MTTAISVSRSALAAVAPQEFRLSDYQQVPVPKGGSTTWSWSTVIGDNADKALVGVPVALSEVQYDLWPTVGEASKGTLPYLRSHDCVTAVQIGDDPGDLDQKLLKAAKLPDGTYDCSKLGGYFAWVDRKPPRANGTSIIMLLREEDARPVYVRLSKTSSPNVQKFFAQVKAQGLMPYETVVSLTLEAVKGSKATYTRVVPTFIRKAGEGAAEAFGPFFESVSPLLRSPLKRFERETEKVPF
jgi:hypothetical protein